MQFPFTSCVFLLLAKNHQTPPWLVYFNIYRLLVRLLQTTSFVYIYSANLFGHNKNQYTTGISSRITITTQIKDHCTRYLLFAMLQQLPNTEEDGGGGDKSSNSGFWAALRWSRAFSVGTFEDQRRRQITRRRLLQLICREHFLIKSPAISAIDQLQREGNLGFCLIFRNKLYDRPRSPIKADDLKRHSYLGCIQVN